MKHDLCWRAMALACLSLGAAWMLPACAPRRTPVAAPVPVVTVASPVAREVVEWDEFTGRLEATELVEVRARVSGFVERADFQEGSIVNERDELFQIDQRPFRVAVARAEADLARAQAELANQTTNVSRLQEAVAASAASQKELEDARTGEQAARAGVDAAQAALDAANLDLEWTTVRAPITGRVSRKLVTRGNLITGGPGQSTLLTVIASTNPMYCYFEADEKSVLKYKRLAREGLRPSAREGQVPCYLQLAEDEPVLTAGHIDFVDNRLNPQTGTITYRAVFANVDRRLVPGLFARVRLPGSGVYAAILVPESALGIDQDRRYVTIVNADNVVERRPVEVGAVFGRLRAVTRGLTASDRVVINGLVRALPGTRVAVQAGEIDTRDLEALMPVAPRDLPAAMRSTVSGAVQPATGVSTGAAPAPTAAPGAGSTAGSGS